MLTPSPMITIVTQAILTNVLQKHVLHQGMIRSVVVLVQTKISNIPAWMRPINVEYLRSVLRISAKSTHNLIELRPHLFKYHFTCFTRIVVRYSDTNVEYFCAE